MDCSLRLSRWCSAAPLLQRLEQRRIWQDTPELALPNARLRYNPRSSIPQIPSPPPTLDCEECCCADCIANGHSAAPVPGYLARCAAVQAVAVTGLRCTTGSTSSCNPSTLRTTTR